MGEVRFLQMPKLGLTMTEGTVIEWRLAEGARFAHEDTCLVVENDKVTTEIPAPGAGRLLKILVPQGEAVAVGTVLAEWEADIVEDAAAEDTGVEPAVAAAVEPPAAATGRRWSKASAMELTTARRLSESKRSIPHFYLATEIGIGRLEALRAQRNADGTGIRITLTHAIVAAAAGAIARHPAVNRVWQDDGFVELEDVDVGVAVHTRLGLFAPVLRRADRRSLEELARETDLLVDRARTATLTHDDVRGGALTVSNAGMHDVTWMSSIINPGQSAILAVGAARETFRPDSRGAPQLVREIGVVLSCDHRVLDAVRALAFLNDVRKTLEAPEALFVR